MPLKSSQIQQKGDFIQSYVIFNPSANINQNSLKKMNLKETFITHPIQNKKVYSLINPLFEATPDDDATKLHKP